VTSAAAANPPRAKASEQPAAEEAPATEPAPAASSEPTTAEAGAPEGGGEEAGREEPETDPNLGAHLSAEVLRRELDSRPHELVGAAASAAETGSLPSVASRTAARRAAAILTHRSPEPEEDADEPTPPARPVRRWFRIGLGAVAALALILGVWFGYAWTQTRYYVGAYDNRVAIYNGVSQQLGPISLSHVHSATNIPLDSLSPYTQQRLRSGVPADGLEAAEDIVHAIQADPRGCLPGSGATASAAPSSTATHGASPSASAKPSASGSAAPSGSPSASPTTTPDPCLGGTR
jgi:protein phosphatase